MQQEQIGKLKLYLNECYPAASTATPGRSSGGTATPSRKATIRPEFAATRCPGTIMPTRLRGSAAETVTVSPVGGKLRCARRDSTASGKANCSPTKPQL